MFSVEIALFVDVVLIQSDVEDIDVVAFSFLKEEIILARCSSFDFIYGSRELVVVDPVILITSWKFAPAFANCQQFMVYPNN